MNIDKCKNNIRFLLIHSYAVLYIVDIYRIFTDRKIHEII